MKSGELRREMVVEDKKGRRTRVVSSRFASMDDPHRAGLRYALTPLNYQGQLEIRSGLEGRHSNAGVERYNSLNQKHMKPVSEEVIEDRMDLYVKTTQSDISIAMCARNNVITTGEMALQTTQTESGWISQTYSVEADKDQEVILEKRIALFTSRDPGVDDPLGNARAVVDGMGSYGEELALSATAWDRIWDEVDVSIDGDREAQRLVRLHLFHMMVTASPHHAGLDAGIAPRGLHGEAYRGHIFWDELYMLPLYNMHFPEVTRSVLMYRYNRLDAARAYAKEYGYEGAMFPWQSGSDGREETQVIHLNPLSGEWGDDYSSLQRHISLAIAYNVWCYYHSTGDLAFMDHFGAEILLDICKFWVSKSKFDQESGRTHIDKVMGPDEFHEKLPGEDEGGLTDNAYSNVMVSWMLSKAFQVLDELTGDHRSRILELLSLEESDLNHWKEVMQTLALNVNEEGIIEQFRGYFGLQELDWDHYGEKYEDIHRLDRILKAEGKSPDDFKLSKQADLLMGVYNLGEKIFRSIVTELGYDLPGDFLEKNFDYYIDRTSHGSTLSRLVHARLAWQMGRKETGWELFMDALRSDLVDIQGGTTGEGIHCGVMAGTVYDVISTFGGLNLRGDQPSLDPELPSHWKGLQFGFSHKGTRYQVAVSPKEIKISQKNGGKEKIKVHLCGKDVELPVNEPFIIKCN